jgi:hypothetical protein
VIELTQLELEALEHSPLKPRKNPAAQKRGGIPRDELGRFCKKKKQRKTA